MDRTLQLAGMPHSLIALLTNVLLAAGSADAAMTSLSSNIASGAVPIVPTVTLAPTLTKPAPPLSTNVGTKTSTAMLIAWQDGSTNEDGYRIERQDGATWSTVKTVGPVGGPVIGIGSNYKVTGLTQNTRYCFRVVPFNAAGAPSPTPVCTSTTQVVGPITVVVSDLQGLQGELMNDEPLDYRPIASLSVTTEFELAPPPQPEFSIPPARKIVYVADSAVIRIPTGATFRIGEGVHLMSGRGGLKRGALLYSDATRDTTMITIAGHNARISGLRLRGPSAGTEESLPEVVGVLARDVLDIVIDHNEFSQWPGSAVRVEHAVGMLQSVTAFRMRITENYFHHNQRRNGGYGVVVKRGSYAYIDKNTFDWNRHAIAADGGADAILDSSYGPQKGYLAYLNVVLPGHSPIEYGGLVDHYTHNFDVHGTEDDWMGVDHYDGWAGEFFDVANNSFLSTKGTLFNVRGTPSDHAYFHHNVAPLGLGGVNGGGIPFTSWEMVSDESDRDNIEVFENIQSVDPRENLGVGDFDGDGRRDVFLATGRAWYVSYAGLSEWRFLRASDQDMSALFLLDLDGNNRTDVVAQIGNGWQVALNGSAAFKPLATRPFLPPQAFYTNGGDLRGDFSGDGVLDFLRFEPYEDRYFRITDGATGTASTSRQQM